MDMLYTTIQNPDSEMNGLLLPKKEVGTESHPNEATALFFQINYLGICIEQL